MDDYLKQLADLMNENARKSKEENMAFAEDVNTKMPNIPMLGSQRFPLTKQLISQNPNLPQEDLKDYAQNVKNDSEENMMAIGGMSGGLKMLKPAAQAGMKLLPKIAPKIAEALDNAPRYAKDLAQEYLPKSISSKVDDLYYGAKAKDNVTRFTNADINNAKLRALEDLAMTKPRDQIEIPKDFKPMSVIEAQNRSNIQKTLSQQAERDYLAKQGLTPEQIEQALEKTITTTGSKK